MFAERFYILFNCKKTVCIQFSEIHNDREHAYLNNNRIIWVNSIRHLGNFIDLKMNDNIDCIYKSSVFIGHVNKLIANFRHLQPTVLTRLFKTYCSSFYGSQLWHLNSAFIDRVCTVWNKGVRRIFNLPNDSHTWMLGPLLHQHHIRFQFYHRCLRFLHSMTQCNNDMVKTCINHAMQKAN